MVKIFNNFGPQVSLPTRVKALFRRRFAHVGNTYVTERARDNVRAATLRDAQKI